MSGLDVYSEIIDETVSLEIAREITEQLRQAINAAMDQQAKVWALMQRAYAGQVWVPMGYPSFGAWGQAELSEGRLGRSKAEVEAFAAIYWAGKGENNPAGIPVTQIASALGIKTSTLRAAGARIRQPARELEVARRVSRPPQAREAIRLNEIAEITRAAEAEGRKVTQVELAALVDVTQSVISGDIAVLEAQGWRPPPLAEGLKPLAETHLLAHTAAAQATAASSSIMHVRAIDPGTAWLGRFSQAAPELRRVAALLRSALTDASHAGDTGFVAQAREIAAEPAAAAFHDLYLFLRDVLRMDAPHALQTGEVRFRDGGTP